MIYKCNICIIPCFLSMDGVPDTLCPNKDISSLRARWMQTAGMFLSEVPA